MSAVLKSWPPGAKRGSNNPYPWDKWFNGRIWQLEAGKDFHVSVKSFATALRTRARALGLTVRSATVGGRYLVVENLTPTQPT